MSDHRVRELMETETVHDDVCRSRRSGLDRSDCLGSRGRSGLVRLSWPRSPKKRTRLPGPFLSNLVCRALIARAGNRAARKIPAPPLAVGELKATVAVLEESAS